MVGNSGDGELALYEGGEDGLDLVSVESEPNLPDPTDMAFSALTGGEVEFYAATAGREEADLVALSLSIELETGTGTGGESPGSPSSGLPTGTATAGTSLTSPFTVQLSATGTLGASPGSPSSLQLVALNDTSLPLAATVLTLTLEVASEETGPALAETEALGIVASLVAPGISAGQGSLSAARGGGSEGDPIEGSDEPGATGPDVSGGAGALGTVRAGTGRGARGAGASGRGRADGSVPAGRSTGTISPGRSCRRTAAGRGYARSRIGPQAPRWRIPAISLPANSTGALDAVNARVQDPWRRGADRDRRADVIDVAIATLDADRSGDHRDEDKLPAHRLAIDSAGLAPVFVAVCHLASRLVRPLAATWRSGFARGEEGGRRVAVAIVRESARRSKGYPPTAASRWWTMSSLSIRTRGRTASGRRRGNPRDLCRPRPGQGQSRSSEMFTIRRSHAPRDLAGADPMCTNVRYPKNADTPRRRARRTAPACVFSGTMFRLRPRVEWMEDRTLLSTFLVSNTGDSGPGSLRQAILDSNAAIGATNTIDFDISGSGVQTIAPALLPARDHQPGPDRRLLPAGLRRHAADRARRQPGRRRRRPADHRRGRDRPRPGHRRLLPGCRHSPHRDRRDRRLDLRQLPGDRSDRHAGRAQRRGRRDRRGSQRQPDRDQRRRRQRRGRAEPDQRQPAGWRLDHRARYRRQRRRGQPHRDRSQGIVRPRERCPGRGTRLRGRADHHRRHRRRGRQRHLRQRWRRHLDLR